MDKIGSILLAHSEHVSLRTVEGDHGRPGQRFGVLEHRRHLRGRGVPAVEGAGDHAHVSGRPLCLGPGYGSSPRDAEVPARLWATKSGSKVIKLREDNLNLTTERFLTNRSLKQLYGEHTSVIQYMNEVDYQCSGFLAESGI